MVPPAGYCSNHPAMSYSFQQLGGSGATLAAHPKHYTLPPTPLTPHCSPDAPRPKPCTLHPTPHTLDHTPSLSLAFSVRVTDKKKHSLLLSIWRFSWHGTDLVEEEGVGALVERKQRERLDRLQEQADLRTTMKQKFGAVPLRARISGS